MTKSPARLRFLHALILAPVAMVCVIIVPPQAANAAALTVQPLDSYSARLTWTLPTGAAQVRVYRNTRLIDEFPASSALSYTDYLLWQKTTYTWRVKVTDQTGTVIRDVSASATTPGRSRSFPRFYADWRFWKTPIGPSSAIDVNSEAMDKTSLIDGESLGVVNNDNNWGIPLAYASPSSKLYSVGCYKYGCETPVSFQIPRYAKANWGSDGHLTVYDPSSNTELDIGGGIYDAATDTWSARSRSVMVADRGSACPSGQRCSGGATGAGFNVFAGVVRPEEIAQGHIDHALAMGVPYMRAKYIACPATNYWASASYADDANAIPLGARIQLDPSFDVSAQSWPRWKKVIARALQKYGAYMVDRSGSVEVRAEANLIRGYDAWAKVGMITSPHPSLRDLPWRKFRVLSMQPC